MAIAATMRPELQTISAAMMAIATATGTGTRFAAASVSTAESGAMMRNTRSLP